MDNVIATVANVEVAPTRKKRVANAIIDWPQGDFTLKEVKSEASASTVYQKLRADLEANKLRVTGKRSEGVGRPVLVFARVS